MGIMITDIKMLSVISAEIGRWAPSLHYAAHREQSHQREGVAESAQRGERFKLWMLLELNEHDLPLGAGDPIY